jgi:hypothetical protein
VKAEYQDFPTAFTYEELKERLLEIIKQQELEKK